jgi:hypothetical protein
MVSFGIQARYRSSCTETNWLKLRFPHPTLKIRVQVAGAEKLRELLMIVIF